MSKIVSILIFIHFAISASQFLDDDRGYYHSREHKTLKLPNETGYRLPNNTYPLRYEIALTTEIHAGNFSFEGFVRIHVKVKQDSDAITLHSSHNRIRNIRLVAVNGTEIELNEFSQNPIYDEFLIVPLKTERRLNVGDELILEIEYDGVLRRDDRGFFRTSYTDENFKTQWLATTQFQPTDARSAFPCYDEPGIRSRWQLKITHGRSYQAISNMNGIRVESANDMITTVFDETPEMQSYLISFLVSNYNYISNNASDGLPQRVFASPEAIRLKQADYALNIGIKTLDELQKHLRVIYALPKMDQAVVPEQGFSAMENWGLVLYREKTLLFSPDDGLGVKYTIVRHITHEFTHQWFGNLVSPAWWSYFWLNEGFATYYEAFIGDLTTPEFRYLDFFVNLNVQSSLKKDSTEYARAMTSYVESPSEINNIFDYVSYGKAASFIRMLQFSLGERTFTKGLTNYLRDMEYKSATPQDLARNLDKAILEEGALPSYIHVSQIIDSWTLQSGYPIVYVDRDASTDHLYISQEKYFNDQRAKPSNDLWIIPLSIAIASDPRFHDTLPTYWLERVKNITISPSQSLSWTQSDWIIVNKQQAGFYRVNYNRRNWELITHELRFGNYSKIHLLNRAQLLDDAFDLAQSGILDFDIFFELISYIDQDSDYIAWATADECLAFLYRMLRDFDGFEYFKLFLQRLIESHYKAFGVQNGLNEDLYTPLMRKVAIKWACRAEINACLDETNYQMGLLLVNSSHNVEEDLKMTIYCNGMREATADQFRGMWRRMQESVDEDERDAIVYSLGCSQDEKLLKWYMETTVNETVSYDYYERNIALASVFSNGANGVIISLEFLIENYTDVDELYDNSSPLKSIAWSLSLRITTEEQLKLFNRFLNQITPDYVSNETRLEMSIQAEENLLWMNERSPEIFHWLSDNYSGSSSRSALSFELLILLSSCSWLLVS